MNRGIFFVGGASASGKSTATQAMAGTHGVPRIELDALYNSLDIIPDSGLRRDAMNSMTEALLRQLIFSGADMIVEGGWLWPNVAASLEQSNHGQFRAIYCGYPNTSAEARLQMLHANASKPHWVVSRSRNAALAWLSEQISGSADYKSACKDESLDFIDFGDPQAGTQVLLSKYREWRS